MPAKHLYRTDSGKTYSHIYNNGVEKRTIFNDAEDFDIFLGYLRDYLTPPADRESTKKSFTVKGQVFRGTPHQPKNYFNKVELIAYKLASNRFDLLLHQLAPTSIEGFVRSLCTRYSMYFNKKYKRSGALFEGPYKSVRVKDEPSLLPLTGYFHHTEGHSSYPEYLGTRETSWIKPKVVLSFFDEEDNSYKTFVESYVPDQEEKEVLEEAPTAKVAEAPHATEQIQQEPGPKAPERTFELIATMVASFIFLVALGVVNIQASENKALLPSSTPVVLSSEAKEVEPNDAPAPAPEEPKTEPMVQEVPNPQALATIKINDGAQSVNIRERPTIYSEKIGDAFEGETFEFVSKAAGWYEIKLEGEAIGFISAKYIEVLQTIN